MNLQDYYQENGYILIPKLIPTNSIDKILNVYKQDIVTSKYPFFRQNTNRYEANEINEFGYVKQAFLDVHDYKNFSEFSTLAKKYFVE